MQFWANTHQMAQNPPLPPAHIRFATAALGGCMAWTVVHPLNTISVQRNLACVGHSPLAAAKESLAAFVMSAVKRDGVRGLYRGLSAGYTRQLFYTTCQVGLFETLRDEMTKWRPLDLPARLVIGCTSGALAAAASCPAEVALVRMSNDAALPLELRRNYRGIFDALVRIVKHEGPSHLFVGCGPFVARAVLVGAFQIGTYDHFRALFSGWGVTAPIGNVICASMAAGLSYSIVTMPLESAKNLLAFQRHAAERGSNGNGTQHTRYTSMAQALAALYRQAGGGHAWWRGFVPYYARCGTFSVALFLSLEWLRGLHAALTAK